MSSLEVQSCSKCSRPLSALTPEGLCSACLLARALTSEVEQEILDEDVRVIGDYELGEQIARGGMGLVYRARQRSLNRRVALKVVSMGAFAPPELIERFRVEAEAAAGLHHPNIVPIYEVGEDDGRHFLSMQLAEGGTLADRLVKHGRPAVRDAAELMVKLARAVHHAHQRGILHRDIKPSNVLLDASGEPLLGDFGLAKLIERDSLITHTLAVLGTPAYISPEQAEGRGGLTTGTDVYGLGAVLYELLTGQPPFAGGTSMATVRLVLEKEPERPSLRNPAVDRDLETICLKCLEKLPELRYASAEALGADLRRWLDGEPITARPSTSWSRTKKWMRRNPARAIAVITAVLAAISITVVSHVMRARVSAALEVSREQTRRILEQERVMAGREASAIRQLSRSLFLQGVQYAEADRTGPALAHWAEAVRLNPSNSAAAARIYHTLTRHHFPQPAFAPVEKHGKVMACAFSPDGSRVAAVTQGARHQFWLRDAATGQRLQSSPLDAAGLHLAFSRDGRFIATAAGLYGWGKEGRVRLVDVFSGEARFPDVRLADGVTAMSYSPDQSVLAVIVNQGPLVVLDAATGQQRFVVERPPGLHAFHSLVWAADSGTLFVGDSASTVRRLDARTGAEIPWWMERNTRHSGYLAMSPNGEALAISGADGVRIYSVETGRRLQSLPESMARHWFGFSPDGKHLLTCGQDGSLRLWDFREARLVASFQAGVPQFRASFSPDGRRFLSHGHDDAVRVWDVQRAAEFCEPIRHATPVVSAAYGPTGERIVTGTAGGSLTVWNLASARASDVRLTHSAAVHSAAFSGDDTRIVTGSGDGLVRVWDRGNHQLVSILDARQDGVRGAFGVRYGAQDKLILALSRSGLRVWNAGSGEPAGPLVRTEKPSVAALSPDGRLVAANFSEVVEEGASARRVSFVRIWDVNTGELRLSIPQPNQIAAFQFSADGNQLLVANYALAVELWDVRTGEVIRKVSSGSGPLHQVGYVRRGTRILAFDGFDLVLVDSQPGGSVKTRVRSLIEITQAAVSEDGSRVVTTSVDGFLRLYDGHSAEQIAEPIPQGKGVGRIAMDPAGDRFAVCGLDGRIEIYDMETGRSLTGGLWHQDRHMANTMFQITSMAFARDGTQLLTAATDGTARLWDLGPRRADSIPVWLPDLAESIGGLQIRLRPGGEATPQLTVVPHAKTAETLIRLRAFPGTNAWERLAGWFLAAPEARADSPMLQDPARP